MSEMPSPQQLSTDSVPQPPRPLTAKVRKRVLNEPTVRFWGILAALVLTSFVVATISGIMQWQSEAKVINSGPVVKAIGFGDGAKIKGRPLAIGSTVYIEYDYNGKKYKSQGPLIATGTQYTAGEPFDIRLDPDEPTIWTNRSKAATLHEKLIGSGITLFFAVICVGAGLFTRQRYVSLWRMGEIYTAKVMDHRQMALAPKSTAMQCAVRIDKKDYLVIVYLPHSASMPAPGQTLQLVCNDTGSRAVALSNYA